ncbi:MAG TPA: DUF3618 domain-containing protein [Micromonosporaceae bacterium]|jgi:ElaB/YqjD/DUF883 family membrane-anchored ribosome-binding protein
MSQEATARGPEELRADIEATRQDLGETVEALAAKTDVKARAKGAAGEAVEQAKDTVRSVRDQAGDATKSTIQSVRDHADEAVARVPEQARKPLPVAVMAAVGAALGGIVYLIRRRRS